MIEERIIKPPNTRKTENKKIVITWRNEPMIRNHSIRATVDEILKMSEMLDVVKINIIGIRNNLFI